jgi:hypothetical protein
MEDAVHQSLALTSVMASGQFQGIHAMSSEAAAAAVVVELLSQLLAAKKNTMTRASFATWTPTKSLTTKWHKQRRW